MKVDCGARPDEVAGVQVSSNGLFGRSARGLDMLRTGQSARAPERQSARAPERQSARAAIHALSPN